MWSDKTYTGMARCPANEIDVNCALARPMLEYCTPRSGTSFSNVRLVERVGLRRSMTKYICDFSAASYKERLLKIKMLALSMRREQNDITFFWKCLNGKYEVHISKYVPTARQMKDFS